MVIVAIYLLTEKTYKFKTDDKNVNFPTQFSVGSMSENFDYVKEEEVSLKGNACDFSVDYNAIDKPQIMDIHTVGSLISLTPLIFFKKFSKPLLLLGH